MRAWRRRPDPRRLIVPLIGMGGIVYGLSVERDAPLRKPILLLGLAIWLLVEIRRFWTPDPE